MPARHWPLCQNGIVLPGKMDRAAMFSGVKSIARGIGQAVLAATAAVIVSLICLTALAFTLICAAPLQKLRA
jgi:hypothetical protein